MPKYLHAFTLDPNKAFPDHPDMIVGPVDSMLITWDFLRAGPDDGDYEHCFIRDESGYWYLVASRIFDNPNSGSMEPDYFRGRFSDIALVTFEEEPVGAIPITEVIVKREGKLLDQAAVLEQAFVACDLETASGQEIADNMNYRIHLLLAQTVRLG